MNKNKLLFSFGFIGIILFLFPDLLFGQTTVDSWAQSIDSFENVDSIAWKNSALAIGRRIFAGCMVIDIVFFAIRVQFGFSQKPTMQEMMYQGGIYLLMFVLLMSFHYFELLIDGMQELAIFITGEEESLDEGDLLALGFSTWTKIIAAEIFSIELWDLATAGITTINKILIVFWAGLFIFIAFIVMAIQFAYITIEVVLTISFGPIFFGFLPLSATRKYSERYISYLISLAVKVFIFYCLMGFILAVLTTLESNIENAGAFSYRPVFEMLFFAWLSVSLLKNLPNEISEYLTDNVSFSISDLLSSRG